ncbi:carbohydrate ABC transporter permease [Candidatus Gracilibacteria bacterium]|nr:carbohydrate ABC transporter permease [Candidatus Gracilibacteria bacterium]
MSTTTATSAAPKAQTRAASGKRNKLISEIIVNVTLALVCLIWTIPTIGLLVSSFRTRDDIISSGWWTIFPHQAFEEVERIDLGRETPLDQPITVLGQQVTDQQLRDGITLADGRQAQWYSRIQRIVSLQAQVWTTNTSFTLENYQNVLTGQQYTYTLADGTERTEQGNDMSGSFLNSLTVAIPATIIPILIAAFAAYGFAWMRFPGRGLLFAIVVALLVVPLQIALIPILRDYTSLQINGTFLALWLAHTGFGLPLATYLLYNYIAELPREIFESAFIDGATPFTVFTRLVLPLSVPALASFAIFQFLWVWNDYLVGLIFIGSTPNTQLLTMRLAEMVGSRGQDWHLLTAGAFISMLLPLIVFFSLQRFFVRGLLAGSVKDKRFNRKDAKYAMALGSGTACCAAPEGHCNVFGLPHTPRRRRYYNHRAPLRLPVRFKKKLW